MKCVYKRRPYRSIAASGIARVSPVTEPFILRYVYPFGFWILLWGDPAQASGCHSTLISVCDSVFLTRFHLSPFTVSLSIYLVTPAHSHLRTPRAAPILTQGPRAAARGPNRDTRPARAAQDRTHTLASQPARHRETSGQTAGRGLVAASSHASERATSALISASLAAPPPRAAWRSSPAVICVGIRGQRMKRVATKTRAASGPRPPHGVAGAHHAQCTPCAAEGP